MKKKYVVWSVLGIVLLLVFFFGFLPLWNVWSSGMAGRAELNQADFNRQVQIVNAKANLQAQQYNADSEVIRAGGVAKANNIIKDSITDQYIRYLWVQTLDKGTHDQIIYVPTEMGLPITESGRLPANAVNK